jgi:DNA-binding transcriptional LysR family regulator
MDQLQCMRAFSQVAESGSFTNAATKLNIHRTVITKLVMQLESNLGARLLNRTTRRVSLTPIGQAYLERIAPAIAEIEAAREVAGSLTHQLTGVIRITAPVSLGAGYLGPVLADFLQINPSLSIDVVLNDRLVDLTEEGFDVAIRVASNPPLHQISRRISTVTFGTFASPDYLARYGLPTHPNDLAGKHLATRYSYLPSDRWRFRDPETGREISIPFQARLSCNNGDLLGQAAAHGLGLVVGPYFTVSAGLAAGHLVPILKPFWPPLVGVQAVMPSRLYQPAKVRALIDFLAQRWSDQPPWEPAASAQ